jgi:hypothetical protein
MSDLEVHHTEDKIVKLLLLGPFEMYAPPGPFEMYPFEMYAPPGPFEMYAPPEPFEMYAPPGPFEMCAPPEPFEMYAPPWLCKHVHMT